jgi:hypothetical protein
MKLNRNNYEEYFILYMDNELSSDERREVELFLQENPDLKAEMDLLLQSKMLPDAEVRFGDIGSLMRFENTSISRDNYEEWLLSYIDDELNNKQKAELELFLAANPAVQKELDVLQRTKLQPEAIVFPGKESLYRHEEKVKVITMRWWRVAIAAALIIGIATTGVLLMNNRAGQGANGIANGGNPSNPKGNSTPASIDTKSTELAEKTTPAVTAPVETADKSRDQHEAPRNTETSRQDQQLAVNTTDKIIAPGKQDEPDHTRSPIDISKAVDKRQDAIAGTMQRKDNDLPKPTKENPYVSIAGTPDDPAINASGSDLTKTQPSQDKTPVTQTGTGSYNNSNSESQNNNSDVRFASETSNKGQKGGIRGFLRKVTRTFEKKTNIKATDDDDRLLIAGLAIKLN